MRSKNCNLSPHPSNPAPAPLDPLRMQPPPPLPPLDPRDHELLTRYFDLSEDTAALAQDSGLRLLDLYAWASLPHIRAYIDFHRAHAAHLLRLGARFVLHATLAESEDPLERLRAATALLRELREPGSPAPRAPRNPRPNPSPDPFDITPRPAGGGHSNLSTVNPPLPDRDSEPQNPDSQRCREPHTPEDRPVREFTGVSQEDRPPCRERGGG